MRIVDQRLLPERCVERDLRTLEDVVDAIRTLAVRGAPAIGIAGAMGVVVAVERHVGEPRAQLANRVQAAAAAIRATRPTAINLPSALGRMLRRLDATAGDSPCLLQALRAEATAILNEDRDMCQRIGEHGVALLSDGARVLTHCNAGALATGGIGTALAPLYVAAERGIRVEVYVNETRPLLQGSRLTAWELARAGIPVTVLTDGMTASLMQAGRVDLCIVGADRIAANGDVANKIGTYPLAVLAARHDVPFYVAAPVSTIDPSTPSGAEIPIEERDPAEVTTGDDAFNPAFDVTPAELVTAIFTEAGVLEPPYGKSIARLF